MKDKRTHAKVIVEINDTLEQAVISGDLIRIRSTQVSESKDGHYCPYNRDILRAKSPAIYDSLREKFSALDTEYLVLQKTDSDPEGIRAKPHKNIPTFLDGSITSITIRKNSAYKGFDIEQTSDSKFPLFSHKEEGGFGSKELHEEAMKANYNSMLSLGNEIMKQTNGQLEFEVEQGFVTTSLMVKSSEFYAYAQTLGQFSRIRYRWKTGTQYRAQLQRGIDEPLEQKWGVLILPYNTPVQLRDIYFPNPRKPRRNTLEDPNKATKLTKIGDIDIYTHNNAEIFLVK